MDLYGCIKYYLTLIAVTDYTQNLIVYRMLEILFINTYFIYKVILL